ncbi:MAG: hypothetical protein ACRDHM_07415 [Actinomycetota bacterium]
MGEKTLQIKYVGDASGVTKALGTMDKAHATFASKLQSLGKSMTSVGKSMTLGITLPFVAFGKVAVDELGEAQKATAQTEAVIKSTGGAAKVTAGEIAGMSERLAGMAVVDDELVQQGANVLLTFTRIRNEAGKGNDIFNQATKATLDLSTSMGKDLNSSAVMVGKALNDPIRGMTALTRVGVTFDDKQRELVAHMVETGDTMGAQKLILAELRTEFGGSAAAAGKAATPIEKLKVTFANFAEHAGAILLPIVEKITSFLGGLFRAFQNLSPGAQKTIVTILAVAAAVGPLLLIFGKLISGVGAVIGVFNSLRVALLANPFVAIAAAVVAIGVLIVAKWDAIKAFLGRIWDSIKQVATTIWNGIKGFFVAIFDAVKGAFSTAWNAIKGVLVSIWNGIKGAAQTIWNAIKAVIIDPIKAVVGVLKEIWNGIKSAAIAAWNGIKSGVIAAVNAIIGAIQKLIGWIRQAIDWLGDLFSKASALESKVAGIKTGAGVGLGHAQSGGGVLQAGLIRVGEGGSEIVALPAGAHVFPHGAQPGVAAAAAPGPGGPSSVTNIGPFYVTVRGGPQSAGRAVLRELQRAVSDARLR